MSPLAPTFWLLLSILLFGAAAVMDRQGRTRAAASLAMSGVVVFCTMLASLDSVQWGVDPAPTSVPSYDPETCMDLAWLDGRWTCIPWNEAG